MQNCQKIAFLGWLNIFLLISSSLQAQNLGLQVYMDGVAEGYTLFNPETSNDAYLINNCGEVINEWQFTEPPGLTSYLLENGNLLQAGRNTIEIRDWDNNLVWLYDMEANGLQQHHDIEPLPNGNVLCLLTDNYLTPAAAQLGRDTDTFTGSFKLDKVVELQPVGSDDANIVWEWKFADHFVQDVNPDLENFGVIAEHPELIDANYSDNNPTDYTHVNGMDYNAELDQILLSARHLSELYIIDHSTTTEEAAGHTGGNSNKGGDILWRFGNPQVYGQGDESNRRLNRQHDGKWVKEGYEDYGKISVFNNLGFQTNNSSIHLINPQPNGFIYEQSESGAFLPPNYNWSWNGEILGEPMYENKKSGVEALQNGNMMICETGEGRITEVSKEGEILWIYVNPRGDLIEQPPAEPNLQNGIFRAERYDPDYAAFDNVDLTPQGILEETELSLLCANQIQPGGISLRLLLEGPYMGEGQMRASDLESIPESQPFTAAPYNYSGSEALESTSTDVVDWLLLEVRSGSPNLTGSKGTVTIASKAVLLHTDGAVKNADGSSTITMEGLVSGEEYYLCIRHRNHLDILTATPFTAGGLTEIDLSQTTESAFGSDQLSTTFDNFAVLRSGELNQDGAVEMQDYEQWKQRRSTLSAYQQEDLNFDNCIQVSDFDLWFLNQGITGTPEIDFD